MKELVHFLPPDKGYQEAQRLLKSKFGDNYRVLTAHESKALNWAEVKPEDSTSLNRFSIFLMRCKNAMESGKYLSKFEQPDTIQGLTKVPSSRPGQVVFEARQVTFHGHLPDGQAPGQNPPSTK